MIDEVTFLYLLVFGVTMVASVMQTSAGFGYAMICMSIWPLFMPYRTATVIEVLTVIFVSLTVMIRLRKSIRLKLLIWPVISTVLLLPLGLFAMMSSVDPLMRRMLGILMIILAIYFIFLGEKVKIKPTPRNGLIAGAISGFIAGMFGIGGPPMALYCLAATENKQEYNGTLQAYFVLMALYHAVLHLLWGNITLTALSLSAVGLVGMALGSAIGFAIFKKISVAKYSKVVYGFMIVFGAFLVING
jgi:hypothetical protein